jgi:hypothetical protein
MEFIDIVTIIYYVLEILTILYTIYVCVRHTTAPSRVEAAVQATPETMEASYSSAEVEEENILMYLASSWLN